MSSSILTSRYILGLLPRANARDRRPLSRGQTRGKGFEKPSAQRGKGFEKVLTPGTIGFANRQAAVWGNFRIPRSSTIRSGTVARSAK